MATEKPESNVVEKVPYPAPQFSMEQLMQMFVQSQKDVAEANKKLAEALENSRKPYVDPAVAEAKRDAAEERKKQVAIELRKRLLTKQYCLHTRTNSDGTWDEQGRLNIKWHEHSNGIILGTCGTCGSEFNPQKNPKDRELLQRSGKALKSMGRARENTRLM